MNQTLFAAAIRQRAQSPPRLALVLGFFTLPLLPMAFVHGIGLLPLQTAAAYAFILGAGIIGQDFSAGTLQLLFARPVSRGEYVVSRWLAIGAAVTSLVLIQIAIGSGLLAARGETPPPSALALFAGTQILSGFGTVSLLLLLSSFLPGIGDILGVIVLGLAAQGVQIAGSLFHAPWVVRAGVELSRFAAPALDLSQVFTGGPVPWFDVASYFSTVTLCLALAIVILNRRELSYASD
jgi:ABC-type transport system involved in multi-copper enzyme maturation permease subunit